MIIITLYLLSSLLPSLPQLHCFNNVLSERTPFLKIRESYFKFMLANFFLNAFSFINKFFQILNVKIASVSGVIYINF